MSAPKVTIRLAGQRAKLQAAIADAVAAALAAPPIVPGPAVLGWSIGNACNGQIAVQKEGVGRYFAARDGSNIASSTLYALACDLRYAAPVAQPLAASAVPEGWQLVPIEPTDEMRAACHTLNYQDEIDAEWSAMLAAASRQEAQPAVQEIPRHATDEEIAAWVKRHDLSDSLKGDARAAFEDAESLHQTYAAPSQQPAASEVAK